MTRSSTSSPQRPTMHSSATNEVRQHAESLLKQAESGTVRPTIAELARRIGITRPTLYRNHPNVVTDFLAKAARLRHEAPAQPKSNQHLIDTIAQLRQENNDLRLHVELYEEHIRRLTILNNRMSDRLANLDNVISLDQHR